MTRTVQTGQAGGVHNWPYRHSGTVPFKGLVLALAAGLPAAVGLAFAYAYADLGVSRMASNGNPVGQFDTFLHVLCCVAFGAALAAVPGVALRAGKVRNPAAASVVTGVVVVFGYYLSWVAWDCAALDWYGAGQRTVSHLEFARSPLLTAEAAVMINATGTWSLGQVGDANVTGAALTAFWAAEALVIFGAGWRVCRRLNRSPARLRSPRVALADLTPLPPPPADASRTPSVDSPAPPVRTGGRHRTSPRAWSAMRAQHRRIAPPGRFTPLPPKSFPPPPFRA